MRPTLLLALSLVLLAGCGKERQPPSRDPGDAATTGRDVFQSLIDEQTYKGYGFDSLDQARRLEIGDSMEVFDILPERLYGLKPGSDLNAVLVRSPETIYQVTVDGDVKSSVTVMQLSQDAYRAAGFGNAELVKRLSRYRLEGGADGFAVRVLGIYMYFLGRKQDGRFTLTPIADNRDLDLQAGVAYDADAVLQRLRPIVEKSYPPKKTAPGDGGAVIQ